jgi:FtsZ-interacting cell division protein YlmF/DNA-binding XRE family transcriptional regulator
MGDDDEQSAVQDEAPELTEQRFAANLRAAREASGVSQERLADEMAARGWPWRQQTVTRVENGRRMVRLGEAKAVAEILDMSLDQLTWPTPDARIIERLTEWTRAAKAAYRRIAEETSELLRATDLLHFEPTISDLALPSAQRMSDVITDARHARQLTPEGAVAQGVADRTAEAAASADQGLPVPTFRPRTVAGLAEVINALRAGEVVLVDLAQAEAHEIQRIQDFLDGATRVRGGEVEHVAELKYRAVPAKANLWEWAVSEPRSPRGRSYGPDKDSE